MQGLRGQMELPFGERSWDRVKAHIRSEIKKFFSEEDLRNKRLIGEKLLGEAVHPTLFKHLSKDVADELMKIAVEMAKLYGYARTSRLLALDALAAMSVLGEDNVKEKALSFFQELGPNHEEVRQTLEAWERWKEGKLYK